MLILLGCQDEHDSSSNTQIAVEQASEPSEPFGQLVFIEVDVGQQFIAKFDFETRQVNRFFTAPENGWVSQIDVAPDHEQIAIAYAPPPPEGEIQFGYTSLFLTFADETAVPTLLHEKTHPEAIQFNPIWSSDSQSLYYTHVIPNSEDPAQFDIQLERLHFESGETVLIAPDGIWPRLSPDSQTVTYVVVAPQSLGNSLWLANADGTNKVELVSDDQFRVVDVPMFSPDGEWVYFTAAEKQDTAVSWWQLLLGVQTAYAHDIPSDWYRIPTAGGKIEQLTTILETGIYGDFSPDGQFIGFATFNGLYTMRPDGSELQKVLDIGATTSLSWIP